MKTRINLIMLRHPQDGWYICFIQRTDDSERVYECSPASTARIRRIAEQRACISIDDNTFAF